MFVSYPRARKDLREKFMEAVFDASLEQITDTFVDDHIDPGARWDETLRAELYNAEIVLLLLTPEFLTSDYCTNVEGAAALAQHAAGRALVYAVLLDECDFAAKGFDVLPVLPGDGKAIRSARDPGISLDKVQVALKYETYRRFEEKNAAFTWNPASDDVECALVSSHAMDGIRFSTRRGAATRMSIGAAFAATVAVLAVWLFGVDRWWEMFIALLVAAAACGVLAAVLRFAELLAEDEDSDWRFLPEFALLLLVGGVAAALLWCGPLVVIVLGLRIPRGPAIVVISGLAGMIILHGGYNMGRPKRLQVYQDLVHMRRRPKAGWRIDIVETELRRLKKMAEARRREDWLQVWRENAARDAEKRAAAAPAPEPDLSVQEREARAQRTLEDAEAFFKALDEYEKRSRAEERRRWREEAPQRGTPRTLVALIHSDDEESWRDLELTLRDEGLGDLCRFRVCRIDSDNWPPMVEGADLVVPLLSARFAAAPQSATIAEALRSHPEVYAVRLEQVDYQATPFGLRQLLPEHNPASKWPIIEVAWQNVARNLIRKALSGFSLEDGYPPLTVRGWDVDPEGMAAWVWWHTFLGTLAALIMWGVGRHWPVWVSGVAIALPALLTLAISLYREQARVRFGDLRAPNRYAFEAVLFAVMARFLTAAPMVVMFPLVFWLNLSLSPPAQTHALIAFADTGIGCGALFGLLGYIGSRRKRPKVLLKHAPPRPMQTWFGFRDGVLLFRSAYADRRRESAGAIGSIPNRAPIAVEGEHQVMQVSAGRVIRFSIEVLLAITIVWHVFLWFGGDFNRVLLVPISACLALLIVGFIVAVYADLAFWITDERNRTVDSLWWHFKWSVREHLARPFPKAVTFWLLLLFVLDVAARLFSAPTAIPALTLTLAAAIAAGAKVVHLHLSFS